MSLDPVRVSRKDAQASNLPRYFTGVSCKHGHVAERYTANKTCCECGNATSNKAKSKKMAYYSALSNEWRKQNLDKSLTYSRKYVAKNKGLRNLWTANYRSAKDERMPEWLTDDHVWMMAEAYDLAALRTKLTGIMYHVDHVVPLRGARVSGLHVPWNMQVIPGKENTMKGNKYA